MTDSDSGSGGGQPNPVALEQAASAPIEGPGGSTSSVMTEALCGIFIPVAVPAVLLAAARAVSVTDGSAPLRLHELAFGFAAVAMATLVRAASRRDWSVPSVVILAVLMLLWFSVIGVVLDRESGVDELVASVHAGVGAAERSITGGAAEDPETVARFVSSVATLDRVRASAEPQPWVWYLACATGVVCTLISLGYIARVR